MPAGTLAGWYDTKGWGNTNVVFNTLAITFSGCTADWNFGVSGTGNSNTTSITLSTAVSTLAAGGLVQLGNDKNHIYQIISVTNSNTITVNPALAANYINQSVFAGYITQWNDLSGNQRHLCAGPFNTALKNSIFIGSNISATASPNMFINGWYYPSLQIRAVQCLSPMA